MRILFFSYAYPNPWQPGLGTFNRTMLAGLAAAHEVRVVSPVSFVERWQKQPRQTFVAHAGISAEYLPYYYTPKLFREQYDQFLWWSVRTRLRQVIAEFRPDVVLSYWAHPDGAVAVRAAHEAGLPAAVIVGGSDVLVLGRSGHRRAAILKSLQAADAVITVSRDLAKTLERDGLDPDRVHYVSRGVDTQVFHPGDRRAARLQLGLPLDRPVLLGVGRLVSVKDWPTWLQTMEALKNRDISPACYVCGSGPLEPLLRQQIRHNQLEDCVTLRGPQAQSDLAAWYRAADLTVLTSLSEGVPNVLMETLASGGAFVASRVGGIPEIADLIHDRLAPVGNASAFADAIVDRLQHPPAAGMPRRWNPENHSESAVRLAGVLSRLCHTAPLREPTPAVICEIPATVSM